MLVKKTFLIFLIVVSFFIFSSNVKAEEEYNDLYVSSITYVPSKPLVNKKCVITVKIKNGGTERLYSSTGFSDILYSFGSFIKTNTDVSYPSLSNVMSVSGTVTYTYEGYFKKAGDYDLSFIIDNDDHLDEKNEDNNSKSVSIHVASNDETDLIIDSVEFDLEDIAAGETVEIEMIIKNNGNSSLISGAGLTLDDLGAVLPYFNSERDVDDYPSFENPLDPGEKYKIVYNGEFGREGDHTVEFEVNSKKSLTEGDYTNNTYTKDLFIYKNQEAKEDFRIFNIQYDHVSSSSVSFTWQTDKDATCKITWREGIYTATEEEWEETEEISSHVKLVENLKPDTLHKYKIECTRIDNEVDREWKEFTTLKDNNLNLVGGISVNVNSSSKTANFNWTTSLESNGAVYYKKSDSAGYLKESSSDINTLHIIDLSGLDVGVYNYFVSSTSTEDTVFVSNVANFTIVESVEISEESTSTSESSSEVKEAVTYGVEDSGLYGRLKGKIVLTVETNGEAYYLNPTDEKIHFLGRPDDAFNVMREQGIGISNMLLEKIEIGLMDFTGPDRDLDGLSDLIEDAIGIDKAKDDTDGDGYNDRDELASGYDPRKAGTKLGIDKEFTNLHLGKIFLQVEAHGEAWYINPVDAKRYFLGRPADAFAVMRMLGLGISNGNFDSLKGDEVAEEVLEEAKEETKEEEQVVEEEECYINSKYDYKIDCPEGWPLKVINDEWIKIGTVPPKNGQGAITIEIGDTSAIAELKKEADDYGGALKLSEKDTSLGGINGTDLTAENVFMGIKDHYIEVEKGGKYYLLKYTEESTDFVADVLVAIDTFEFID